GNYNHRPRPVERERHQKCHPRRHGALPQWRERENRTGAFRHCRRRSARLNEKGRQTVTIMSKLAFLFPGQASQYAGMGRDLADNFPEARAIFDAADAALEFSLSKLCFDGPEEQLKLTENTQPAILTVSTAAYRALEK